MFCCGGPCALETVESKRAISLVTDEELEQRKDGRIPTNTKHNTNWAIKVWKDWAFERNSLTNNSTAENSVRANTLTNTNEKLNKWLAKFVVEVRKKKRQGSAILQIAYISCVVVCRDSCKIMAGLVSTYLKTVCLNIFRTHLIQK